MQGRNPAGRSNNNRRDGKSNGRYGQRRPKFTTSYKFESARLVREVRLLQYAKDGNNYEEWEREMIVYSENTIII